MLGEGLLLDVLFAYFFAVIVMTIIFVLLNIFIVFLSLFYMRYEAGHFFLELQQQQRCCWGCGRIKEKFKKKIQRFNTCKTTTIENKISTIFITDKTIIKYKIQGVYKNNYPLFLHYKYHYNRYFLNLYKEIFSTFRRK